ncbi:MAG: hypothetical protein Q9198_009556, partial [Flavoplaca austrocitrina]
NEGVPATLVSVSGECEDGTSRLILAETPQNDLLSLRWPSPPRNVLLVEKKNAPDAREALKTFAW